MIKRGVAWLLVVLFCFSISLAPHPSHAQDLPNRDVNLFTSPLPINLSMAPGTETTTDIRVKNGNDVTEKLKVSLMKFSAYGEEGKPALAEREPGDDYFDWVSFNTPTFEAPPNEWKTIKMTIDAPKSAAFGYYYAVVFSRANEPKKADPGNVLLGSTAVLVLVDVKSPNAKRSLQLLSFSADKRSYEFLPANFKVRLHNNGNVHLLPRGNIYIKRGNKVIANLTVNAQGGYILPNSNRVYEASWNDGFPVYKNKEAGGKVLTSEDGKPIRDLEWNFSRLPKLKFGHYKAQLLMAYDNGKQDVPLEATLSFWVVPWRILAVLLVVAILAGIGLWSSGRSIYRKVKKRR
jgi:hypothetical protein